MMTYKAIVAGVARNMMRDKNPVPFFEFLNALAYLDDLSAQLMPKNKRRLLDTIPLHHIAAANAAGNDLYEEFAVTYLRDRPLFKPNIVVIVIDCCSHKI